MFSGFFFFLCAFSDDAEQNKSTQTEAKKKEDKRSVCVFVSLISFPFFEKG
jgi:hypothetical protein